MSAIYHPMGQPNTNSAVATSAHPATISSGTPNIITNPQTFVVPLGVQPPYPAYPIYSTAPGQYPTTPYYQYAAYGQPGVHYAAPPQSNPPSSSSFHGSLRCSPIDSACFDATNSNHYHDTCHRRDSHWQSGSMVRRRNGTAEENGRRK